MLNIISCRGLYYITIWSILSIDYMYKVLDVIKYLLPYAYIYT
jgi:hypothetical protein